MSRPRIVVVDDHPAVRVGLELVLGADGYDVVCHPRAADAVAVIRTVQPILAVVDLHLEYPTAGLDVVRALRADPITTEVAVLVWSTDPAVAQHVAALNVPSVRVLSKYDDVATLRATIAEAATAVDGRDGRWGTVTARTERYADQ